MMPYINPNYFNSPQYQPMYQMPQMGQIQQSNQPTMPNTSNTPFNTSNALNNTLGKVVDSIDVVRATEVPMDGNTYYFPKADGSCVYSKRWLPDGTTQIASFSPDKACETEKPNNYSYNDIKAEIGAITDEIRALQDDIRSLANNIKQPARVKKGALNESNADT